METTNLELIITAVSITGTILAAVLAAFGFLHREMRRGFASVDKKFERIDEKFERMDEKFERIDEKFERMEKKTDEKFDGVDGKFDGLRTVLISVRVSVARIEGHLGIGFPEPAGESPTADDARTGGAAGSATRAGAEVA